MNGSDRMCIGDLLSFRLFDNKFEIENAFDFISISIESEDATRV